MRLEQNPTLGCGGQENVANIQDKHVVRRRGMVGDTYV